MIKKKENLMNAAKETTKLGVLTGAGLTALSTLADSPNMPKAARGNVDITAGNLRLVGVGKLAKTGQTLIGSFEGEVLPTKKKILPRTFAESRINKIIG